MLSVPCYFKTLLFTERIVLSAWQLLYLQHYCICMSVIKVRECHLALIQCKMTGLFESWWCLLNVPIHNSTVIHEKKAVQPFAPPKWQQVLTWSTWKPSTWCTSTHEYTGESLCLRSTPPWGPWPPWSQGEGAGSHHTGTEEGTGLGSHGSSSAPRGLGPGPPCPGPPWPGSPPDPGCCGRHWMAGSGKPAAKEQSGKEK